MQNHITLVILEKEEEKNPKKKQIIYTPNVQLCSFQFAHHSSLCIKMHRIQRTVLKSVHFSAQCVYCKVCRVGYILQSVHCTVLCTLHYKVFSCLHNEPYTAKCKFHCSLCTKLQHCIAQCSLHSTV